MCIRDRPYSHAAYVETVRLCVRARQRSGGREMVFCTGGRTQAGARRQLPHWPESAFVCIGDFIADSLGIACLLYTSQFRGQKQTDQPAYH